MNTVSTVADVVKASSPGYAPNPVFSPLCAVTSSVPLEPLEPSQNKKPVLRLLPKGRILIVDDNEYILTLLEHILSRSGYEVHVVNNGLQALETLQHSSFDLIVTDMIMGGMDGLVLTQYIAQSHPMLPVILITAYSDTESMRKALSAGACDFIAKPFNLETVPLIIERNLFRHAMHTQNVLDLKETAITSAVTALSAAIEINRPSTSYHSRRVVRLCNQIAESLHLSELERKTLALAAEVHDLGKVATPDDILNKPGPLDKEEWEIIRLHPVQGEEMIGTVETLKPIARIVRHHHEWVNGSGYPDRLVGDNIPLLSRIIAVADAYEVMTSDRCYRRSFTKQQAVERLCDAVGTQFDAMVVAAFLENNPELLDI